MKRKVFLLSKTIRSVVTYEVVLYVAQMFESAQSVEDILKIKINRYEHVQSGKQPSRTSEVP